MCLDVTSLYLLFLVHSFDEVAQSLPLCRRYGNEPQANFANTVPMYRRLLNFNWRILIRYVKAQSQLHARVHRTVGLDATATLGQVYHCAERLIKLWTREHTLELHGKAVMPAEVHESLLGIDDHRVRLGRLRISVKNSAEIDHPYSAAVIREEGEITGRNTSHASDTRGAGAPLERRWRSAAP